jgi:hypothetical protein
VCAATARLCTLVVCADGWRVIIIEVQLAVVKVGVQADPMPLLRTAAGRLALLLLLLVTVVVIGKPSTLAPAWAHSSVVTSGVTS